MTSTASEPKCDRCGASSKDLYAEAGGEFLCEKCTFEDAKQKAKWGVVDRPKEEQEKLEYDETPDYAEIMVTENKHVVQAIMALAKRVETTNELLLRLIKRVESVL